MAAWGYALCMGHGGATLMVGGNGEVMDGQAHDGRLYADTQLCGPSELHMVVHYQRGCY